ncbi:unnamed protein product [Arctia plantaginis]|uniref:SEC7 domain-containing protein n=1 Tax=Arctia plantaginis TaxID=874455 RepID=A0A8S0ZBB7_ARCPL|nr:unnamed protein product [Arctia plantaginis]
MGCQTKEVKTEIEIPNGEEERERDAQGHISLELGGLDDASVVSDLVTHDISQYFGGGRIGRHKQTSDLPTEAELDNIKNMKKWVTQGTELFNQKPERGIEFLQEHGVLSTPLEPHQVAIFLRENPDLDKKMIGEYICKRSSRGEDEEGGPSVLGAFADSFDYAGLRIDQALRLYLETFRLPGEAPLIFLVMERFAERWHTTNGEPFANTDAAFRLAYAVIMLNMDQHNHNAKKLNVPMTVEDFVKNLRGCNGSGDFDQAMLEAVFHSIKNEEMVMPAERVGAVRDAYLWRVLQRRGGAPAALYRSVLPAHPIHARLFAVCCPPTVTALSAAFERAPPPTAEELEAVGGAGAGDGASAVAARLGMERCAALVARLPALPPDAISIDTILLTLCKFTGLLAPQHATYIAIGVSLGGATKAQLALRRACALAARHADCVRDSWRHLLEIIKTLYIGRLLPKCLVEAEDYLAPNGTVSLIREAARGSEAGLLSSLYSYIALGESGFCICIYRDRLLSVWEEAGGHMARVLAWAAGGGGAGGGVVRRCVTALLRTAARLMRCDACAPSVLHHLTLLFQLPYKLFYQQADVISCGVYEIVKTSAQNVHSAAEWDVLFALLCAAGAGAWPSDAAHHSPAASSRSEGSEDESDRRPTSVSSESELSHSPQTQGWILVKKEGEGQSAAEWEGSVKLRAVRASALSRCCEALALVVRDVAHVTPYNCRAAVRAVRLFASATLQQPAQHGKKSSKSRSGRKSRPNSGRRRYDDSSDEESDTLDQYHLVSIQLLDLMHTLHSRAAQIFKWWRDEADQAPNAEEYDLWEVAWKPLLQGIAQFCTDRRKQVANSAIAYLQRALLVPGLSAMGAGGWEACFQSVLFPLLEQLPRRADTTARANTIMCKVFLQHLSALSTRGTFGAVWARVLGVQRALLAAPPDDPLTEAALESLKNMILVMDSVRIFSNGDGYNELWYLTWDKISEFLPNLKEELFPQVRDNTNRPPPNLPGHMQPQYPPSLPTLIPVGPNSTPTIVPVPSPQHQSHANGPRLVPVPTQSPTLGQSNAHSPVTVVETPPLAANTPTLVAPTPISGMVPIRNSLYDQTGLTSSVLLQPLNEMISTPIGMSIQSQIPILYPQTVDQTPLTPPSRPEPPCLDQPRADPQRVDHTDTPLDITIVRPETKVEQSELYAEYITNPYNELKDISKEATLYDPENPKIAEKNPLISLLDKKSYSANATPMHTVNKTQFGSTDNVKQESIFNFSSYFGSVTENIAPGSEVFDTLMSTQEG